MATFTREFLAGLVSVIEDAYPQLQGQQQIVFLLAKVDIEFASHATPSSNFKTTLLSTLIDQNEQPKGLEPFFNALLAENRSKVVSYLNTPEKHCQPRESSKFIAVPRVSAQSEVREILKARRPQLEIISQRLHRVRAYKDIHDTLHEIQKECHELMALEFVRKSELSFEPLQDYYVTYCVYWDQLKDIAQAACIEKGEFAWIERRMSLVAQEWEAGLKERNLRRIEKAEMQLRGALGNLSQVNTLLHRSAADMLPDLIKLLDAVTVAVMEIAPATELELRQGLSRLHQLSQKFDPLVEKHHRWQEVDNEMRRIAEFLPDVVDELLASWPLLEELIKLLAEPAEKWCQPLLTLHDSLGRALDQPDSDAIGKSFRRYRKLAGDIFFGVDKRLKAQCEQLPTLATELTRLWDHS
ncbi:hypothetical protein [Bradyrhizobium sp. CW1]|uniref:hypothetical protein n=1 Tax=unclassified Bradyrhizobium TaxID=2631580 RepID=UPI001FFF36B2|nr:hypothetical protein [Bradyrhizobium sp. CW1]UPJ27802.1 hypothetical protein IVB54_01540 [Bradyrhizobium sp. CW1]